MIPWRVIVATLVAPILVIACGSDRLTGPDPGNAVTQGTVAPPTPPFPPVFTPDVEDVIPSGLYTMKIEFDKSCGGSTGGLQPPSQDLRGWVTSRGGLAARPHIIS